MSELTDRMRYIAKHANKHHLEYPDTFNPRTVLAMLDVIDAAEALDEGITAPWDKTNEIRLSEALDRFRKRKVAG